MLKDSCADQKSHNEKVTHVPERVYTIPQAADNNALQPTLTALQYECAAEPSQTCCGHITKLQLGRRCGYFSLSCAARCLPHEPGVLAVGILQSMRASSISDAVQHQDPRAESNDEDQQCGSTNLVGYNQQLQDLNTVSRTNSSFAGRSNSATRPAASTITRS